MKAYETKDKTIFVMAREEEAEAITDALFHKVASLKENASYYERRGDADNAKRSRNQADVLSEMACEIWWAMIERIAKEDE